MKGSDEDRPAKGTRDQGKRKARKRSGDIKRGRAAVAGDDLKGGEKKKKISVGVVFTPATGRTNSCQKKATTFCLWGLEIHARGKVGPLEIIVTRSTITGTPLRNTNQRNLHVRKKKTVSKVKKSGLLQHSQRTVVGGKRLGKNAV